MNITLRYGSSAQSAELPQQWTIDRLRMRASQAPADEAGLVSTALVQPVGTMSLDEFLDGASSAIVLIPDKTRLCRADLALPILLEHITKRVAKDNVTLLFANGTHAAMSKDEQLNTLGRDIVSSFRVLQHDAHASPTRFIGTTRYGTDLHLNDEVLTADRVLTLGTVVHHYFAGYGGGPKMFIPGVASYLTAIQNHQRTLTDEGYFHPGCRDGNVTENPVANDIADAVRFLPTAFSLVTLLDDAGRIVSALSGELSSVHQKAQRLVDEMYCTDVHSPADMVIVSPGGHPKDVNLIQAHKALHRAYAIAKKDGMILCLAECREGIGNDAFLSWFQYGGVKDMAMHVLANYDMNAHTAISLRTKTLAHRISFISALSEETVRALDMHPAQSLQQAVDESVPHLAVHARCVVMDNGSLTVPRLVQ